MNKEEVQDHLDRIYETQPNAKWSYRMGPKGYVIDVVALLESYLELLAVEWEPMTEVVEHPANTPIPFDHSEPDEINVLAPDQAQWVETVTGEEE